MEHENAITDAIKILRRIRQYGYSMDHDLAKVESAEMKLSKILKAREILKNDPIFSRGDKVRKKGNKGQWHGVICGEYSTAITPEGYAVESVYEKGSVQIYPVNALEKWEKINEK